MRLHIRHREPVQQNQNEANHPVPVPNPCEHNGNVIIEFHFQPPMRPEAVSTCGIDMAGAQPGRQIRSGPFRTSRHSGQIDGLVLFRLEKLHVVQNAAAGLSSPDRDENAR